MTPEETIFEKAQWWKAGMLSGSDASLKAVIGYEMKVAIEAAILAEREACAKAMDQQMDIARNEALKAKEKSDEYTVKYYQGCYEGSRRAQLIIRARSNAPESPNKPQVGFFGLDLSSRKAKEENVAPDPVSA